MSSPVNVKIIKPLRARRFTKETLQPQNSCFSFVPFKTHTRKSELLAGSGCFAFRGTGDDAQNFFFAHDDELFAIQLDFRSCVLTKQDAVAFFHCQWEHFAVFVDLAFAGGDDFALLWL